MRHRGDRGEDESDEKKASERTVAVLFYFERNNEFHRERT